MSKSKAVLISDIHFNLNTLQVAKAALTQARDAANELQVPLIIAGDLHDTKANMRAECVKAMLESLDGLEQPCFILRGNHDSVNEKSKEHALEFLAPIENVSIISSPTYDPATRLHLIPYEHDVEELRNHLRAIKEGSTLIMHQGITGSQSGEYIQDKSAINKEDVADFRVISGHYHTRQDIKTGRPRKGAIGLWSYIGNPYTLNFGEAEDPDKGFQILMDDGLLAFIPTNLRKHVTIKAVVSELGAIEEKVFVSSKTWTEQDIVAVTLRGPQSGLSVVRKDFVRFHLRLGDNFRLDLLPDAQNAQAIKIGNLSPVQLLDQLIDVVSNATPEQKERLKHLWKEL